MIILIHNDSWDYVESVLGREFLILKQAYGYIYKRSGWLPFILYIKDSNAVL